MSVWWQHIQTGELGHGKEFPLCRDLTDPAMLARVITRLDLGWVRFREDMTLNIETTAPFQAVVEGMRRWMPPFEQNEMVLITNLRTREHLSCSLQRILRPELTGPRHADHLTRKANPFSYSFMDVCNAKDLHEQHVAIYGYAHQWRKMTPEQSKTLILTQGPPLPEELARWAVRHPNGDLKGFAYLYANQTFPEAVKLSCELPPEVQVAWAEPHTWLGYVFSSYGPAVPFDFQDSTQVQEQFGLFDFTGAPSVMRLACQHYGYNKLVIPRAWENPHP